MNLQNLKILVVDDDDSMRMTMAAVLEESGNIVVEASDGYQAIESVKTDKFDIIFMDIKMPGINGVETFIEIKKNSPQTSVIMMTGFSVEELIEKALREGAYSVIHKPFDMDKIIEIIDDMKKSFILITDDEFNERDTLYNILTEKGFKVDTAEDGYKALEKIQSEKIDIVFLDVKMPGMDGVKAFEEIKKINKDISVVMMTGYNFDEILELALKKGAYACLQKPLNIERIVQLIGEIRAVDKK